MKIGYIVQGSSDQGFLIGLRDRWCAKATIDPLQFRGTRFRPRDYPGVCAEALIKDYDLVVILTDTDTRGWSEVRTEELSRLQEPYEIETLLGVANRNIECWICADQLYVAKRLNIDPSVLRVNDPKRAFQKAMGITRDDKKLDEIAGLIAEAPSLRAFLNNSPSLKAFYREVRAYANRRNCAMRDELQL